jgi:hypothetical protein
MDINHVAWYSLFLVRRNSLYSKRDGDERSFRYRVPKFGKKYSTLDMHVGVFQSRKEYRLATGYGALAGSLKFLSYHAFDLTWSAVSQDS